MSEMRSIRENVTYIYSLQDTKTILNYSKGTKPPKMIETKIRDSNPIRVYRDVLHRVS